MNPFRLCLARCRHRSPLVVLDHDHVLNMRTITEGLKAEFLAIEFLFDHDLRAWVSKQFSTVVDTLGNRVKIVS